ncbi:MAG: phosphate ABC transporter permease subunit PstC [Halobacteriales archaeon]
MSGDAAPYERDPWTVRKEQVYEALLLACVAITVLVTVGIVLSLVFDAAVFFRQVPVLDFLTGTTWEPQVRPHSFGVLPLVSGTLIVTVGSALISLPVGLAAAIYLSEYASRRVRAVLKPALEILAGVPTVVYGYFALVYITPAIRSVLPISLRFSPDFVLVIPQPGTFNALSASIVVGIMIIPMVSSISEDALSAVPDSLRQAGYGLGSTKFDVSTRVVVPSAVSGIVSSYVLAISRAIGETMAVTIAAGQSPQMPYFPRVLRNLTESIETITAAMVEIAFSDIQGESTAFYAMFALGLTLFVITFTMNLVAEYVRLRYQEVYH